jgi:hypothetical protein|tara:strand:- start:25 stop:390 length:366 start_codon:yes stop_codon:yes gene_type:complete
MDYTITELTDGNAVVTFADDSWANVPVLGTDTKEVFEKRLRVFAPKTGVSNPAWIAANQTGSVVQEDYGDSWAFAEVNPAWLDARIAAYGSAISQLEYITENGLAAWQEEVAAIKLANPSS